VKKALTRQPDAITMPEMAARGGLSGQIALGTGLPVIVHTVNDLAKVACLLAHGAAGVYTDDLSDADVAALRKVDAACRLTYAN
jgi:hypothetical protein